MPARHRLHLCLAALLACLAMAFAPPPIDGAVTDTSGKLSAGDDAAIEWDLAARRARTHRQVAVLVVGSLGGESIEDVAYRTFNTWKIGQAGLDDGVVLVVAPNERKMRIETGKGVGHLLTDLESAHILDDRMRPLLREERYRDAILAGVAGIDEALAREAKPGEAEARVAAVADADRSELLLGLGVVALMVGGMILFSWLDYRRRMRAWARGELDGPIVTFSSFSGDSSSGSSSSFDSGSSFSGDGGSSGGGGASSDW
jgi:uncharacterized protein